MLLAAGAVRARQRGIEQGATGVGIDLDEAWPLRTEVKVIAHEHARRTEVVLGDGACPGQRVLLVGRQCHDARYGGHREGQGGVYRRVQKHGGLGKQMGVGAGQRASHAAKICRGLQLLTQTVGIERAAHAVPIELLGKVHGGLFGLIAI
ncbi:MAG: hypothetical protein WAW73_11145 [Rhodoferax sp.]